MSSMQSRTEKIRLAHDYCLNQFQEALASGTAESAMMALFRVDGILAIMDLIQLPEVRTLVEQAPEGDQFANLCREVCLSE